MTVSSSSTSFTDTTYLYDVTTVAQQDVTSSPNITEEERRRYLSYLNDVTFPYRVPTVVYLSILMLLGITGNILVLIVYLKKFKPSPTRVFIVSLAIFDLMTCTISLPVTMLDLRYSHTFEYINLCRILRFNNSFSVLSSGGILVSVAIDRYRKICRPLQRQITVRVSRILVGITTSLSFVLSIPMVIVYGHFTFLTDREGITGVDCSLDDRWRNTIFPLVYFGVLFLICGGSLSVVCIIYILIGKTVFNHRKLKFLSVSGTRSRFSQKSMSDDGKEKNGKKYLIHNGKTCATGKRIAWISSRKTLIHPALISSKYKVSVEESSEMSTFQAVNDGDITNRTSTCLTSFVKLDINRRKCLSTPEGKRRLRFSRTTLMLFIITVVFIISFLPHSILMITRRLKPDFRDSLQGGGRMLYNVFLRSFFINCAANCVVYSFCNIKFRNECKRLLDR